MNGTRFARVGVLGDGVAGWLAALALVEWRPSMEVTVLGGAGDDGLPGAVVLDQDALAWIVGYLGVDLARLWTTAQPTFSLGVRYLWHPDPRRAFDAAFDAGDLPAALAHDRHLARGSLGAQLMAADRAPVARLADEVRWLTDRIPHGYHVATEALRAVLAAEARARGVRSHDAADVVLEADGDVLAVAGAHSPSFDLFVDATAAEAPRSPRDGRVEAWRPRRDAPRVRATAVALRAGWGEVLPLRDRDHIVYRFSRDHTDDASARAELAARFPGAETTARTRADAAAFDGLTRSYRNVVPVGAPAEPADPLGAPPLSRVADHVAALLMLLDRADAHATGGTAPPGWDREAVEALDATFRRGRDRAALIAGLLAWRAPKSPAWDAARTTARTPPLERALDELTRDGPGAAPDRFAVIALGLGLRPRRIEPAVDREGWEALTTMRAHAVRAALPHGEALGLLEAARAPLDALAGDAESWARAAAAPFVAATPTRGRSRASLEAWVGAVGIPARWPNELTRVTPTFPDSPLVDFGKFEVKVPLVALAPRDQAELATTLRELGRRRIPMTIRGAGHSNGGQVLTDSGAVVDVRALRRVVADDPAAEVLTIEGGAWFEEAQVHLHEQGLGRWLTNHLMHWRSTVAGSLAVGGFGDTTHLRGLQTQMVRELVIMTLDGERHRVRPGDALFDYTLAGRGQLGVVTEVSLTTERRSGHITARCVRWATVGDFLADAAAIVADGRYPILRSRMFWDRAEVEGAIGRFGAGPDAHPAVDAARFAGLRAELTTGFQTIDYYAEAMKPKSDHWLAATPAVEFALPCDPDHLDRAEALVAELRERLIACGLARFTPLGTSIMLLPTAGHPPLAPLPATPLALMFALRPEMSPGEAREALPAARAIGRWALERGGKLYLMCVEPDVPDLLERQFGEHLGRLRALKATHDPHGLLNPGLLVRA